MTEPFFLDIDLIIELHDEQIGLYGGSPGTKDHGNQSSTVNDVADFLKKYCINFEIKKR
jgi:hypothetical protein